MARYEILRGVQVDATAAWLVPHVTAAVQAGLVQARSLARIAVDRPDGVRPGTWDVPYGSCLPDGDSGVDLQGGTRYVISIASHVPLTTLLGKVELRALPRQVLLETLAHELAHTRVREHGDEHRALTGKILEVVQEADRRAMGGTAMLAHDSVVVLMEEALGLMTRILPSLRSNPDALVAGPELERYTRFLDGLRAQRDSDQRFIDDAWHWILDDPEGDSHTYLQVYGRLAFISYELFHFL
jgi:hypothetical protein